MGQKVGLRLIFEGCTPTADPVPPNVPKVDGLNLQFYGRSVSESTVNFRAVSASVTYTFAAELTKNQRVEIPLFQVDTNKGIVRVPAVRFDPTAATVGRSGTRLDTVTSAKLALSAPSVWAGEVFDLNAVVSAAKTYYPQFTRGFDWLADPLIVEPWSEPQGVEFANGNEPHTGLLYRTRGVARSPGRYNLNAATHTVNLAVGGGVIGFLQHRQYDQYTITSNTPTLEIKALPQAPAGFGGAVGQFKLAAKVIPEKAVVGEPITWTLELSGTGNWPDIAGLPSRDVSSDFRVVQPKPKRAPADGKIFDASIEEDVVLVPTKAGSYPLGPIHFSYFDPKSGAYKTLTAPRTMVVVTAPSTPQFGHAQSGGTEKSDGANNPEVSRRAPPATPPPPAGLPGDPLPGSDEVSAPLDPRTFVLLLLSPVSLLLAFWAWLALRQAHQTDPLRPRREARARLAVTLAKLRTASETAHPALLLAWQRDTAQLWQISHAAPPASSLSDAAWTTLWLESDRALYGPPPQFPSDWISRAEAALAAKHVPGFKPLRLFLPRNLFPFAALFAVLVLTPVSLLLAADEPSALAKAGDPLAAYRATDFATAEKSWRNTVKLHPTDWIARHNLSLALAQQERPGESAGQATAAFVQNPAAPAARRHFALAAEKAGFVPSSLSSFLRPGPAQSLARLASPARWQRALIAAAFLAALAIGWILFNAYGRRSRVAYFGAPALFTFSVALAVLGVNGVHTYGIAAKGDAVIVARPGTLRSIPTEADTSQKTTALPAGSIACADKTFLRWTRLAFENGQTGWVLKDEIVPLWK
ncbi:MAG: BatD family protein, partial [Opitutaceae bacterium]